MQVASEGRAPPRHTAEQGEWRVKCSDSRAATGGEARGGDGIVVEWSGGERERRGGLGEERVEERGEKRENCGRCYTSCLAFRSFRCELVEKCSIWSELPPQKKAAGC